MIKDKFAAELAQAAENVANHTVELVSGVGKYGTNEIWRCTNNGSSSYGFDLVISRFGIAMYGNVDSLVFGVGSQYGIAFLARESVCQYMISKLEPEYREKRELDEDRLREVLVEQGCQLLEDKFVPYIDENSEEGDNVELSDWVGGSAPITLDMVIMEMQKHAHEQTHCHFDEFCDRVEELIEDRAPNGLQAVEAFIAENYDELNFGSEWYEYTISKYDSRLIQRLEMLRLCALKILEIKKLATAPKNTHKKTKPAIKLALPTFGSF
jgi:hypothetical protein